MDSIAQRHILILGLGESGAAAADLALFQGARVTILDGDASKALDERASRLQHRGADVRLDWVRDRWDGPAELAIISPGIGPESPLGRLAAALPCPVISELEFGFRYCCCPLLAVTGTNGKTTTTELAVHCLNGAGKKVLAAGNIGTPLSEAARKSAGLDAIVVEVSSFQLERVEKFAPLAAAFLNFSSDHLDRYADADAYLAAKLRLFARMPRRDHIVLHRRLLADARVAAALPGGGGEPVTFGGDGAAARPGDLLIDENGTICQKTAVGTEPLLARGDLKLTGEHNAENVCAAVGLCRLFGVEPAVALRLAKKFAPSAHRLELIGVRNGVRYINDSKATNPDALVQALRTCQEQRLRKAGKILLIAGGRDKAMDFRTVTPYLATSVRQVLLIGETRDQLAELWSDTVPCTTYSSLAACIDAAIDQAQSGDTVLLSPGCASQDMFTNYAQRGNIFSQEVKRRLGE